MTVGFGSNAAVVVIVHLEPEAWKHIRERGPDDHSHTIL
jgi:hypothetical protein